MEPYLHFSIRVYCAVFKYRENFFGCVLQNYAITDQAKRNNSVSPYKIVHCFQDDPFLAADGPLVKIHEYKTQNEAKLDTNFLASSRENQPFQSAQITSKGNENHVSTNVSPVAEGPTWVPPVPQCQAAQHTRMQQHYAVH